jgi:tRNA (mo5U34)-methyltransferase
LRNLIRERVPDADGLTALDLSSHKGWFTVEMARHFGFVRGLEFLRDNIGRRGADGSGAANRQPRLHPGRPPAPALRRGFIRRFRADVRAAVSPGKLPIHTLRLAACLCRKHLLIETQVFPHDLAGLVEDGSYRNQRPVHGVFALAPDNPGLSVGGSTDLALMPSLNALIFLLQALGFSNTQVPPPLPDDYEQYQRGSRIVVYAGK